MIMFAGSKMDNSGYEPDLHMQTQNNNKDKAAEVWKPVVLYKYADHVSVFSQASQYTPEEIKAEKKIIYKNVLLISVSFLLLFVAFESMSKLQSSINVVSKGCVTMHFTWAAN